MRLTWIAIGVSAALLAGILILSGVQNSRPGLDPRDQLLFERQRAAQRQLLLASRAVTPPVLACAAGRADEATVQTLYLVWINRRADLTTVTERDDATANVNQSIAACGGDAAAVEDEAHRRGVDLGEAASQAMLKAGR